MKWLREPTLHFAVAASLLFAGYSLGLGSESATAPETPVRIGSGELRWIRETFASQWRRPPNAEEMNGLVETLISEQLLAREARALGLDVDDTVVRRRLAQKLEFMIEDTSRVGEPDDAELRVVYDGSPDLYRSEAKLSFEQIFFSAQQRLRAEADAASALIKISAHPGETAPPSVGDPLPLAPSFSDIDRRSATSLFGAEFADALFETSAGDWLGPVPSAFGFHLIRVTERTPASRLPFELVRDRLAADWRRARNAETKRGYLAGLRTKYGVVVEENRVPAAGGPTP